jgi:glycosyltransferase involved in cell wall biosynthesis/predicted RNA methylase
MNLSIVLPACNEEKRIISTLTNYVEHFPKVCNRLEIIVVVNGSNDKTFSLAKFFSKKYNFVKVVEFKKKIGKGGALILGLSQAKNDIIGFLDADDSFNLTDLNKILDPLKNNQIDVGIASKWKRRSFIQVDEPFSRKVMSRFWNVLTKLFLSLNFKDTQAGAKFFTKEAWDHIPKNFIGKGFEFDVDLLSQFYNFGFKIKEFHIRNKHKEFSKFNNKHIFPMFINFFKIVLRKKEQHPAHYYRAYNQKLGFDHWFYKKKIDFLLSFIPEKSTFLDAGCGSGVLPCLAAKKKNCQVTAVDIRHEQIFFGKRLCPTVNFLQADLFNLNLNKKFSIVNCSDVVEHFKTRDRKIILENLNKHVQDNGKLILLVPSWFYIKIFERFFWKIIRRILNPFTSFDDDIHEVVSLNHVKLFYEKKGFRKLKQGTFMMGLLDYLILKKN